MEVLSASVPHGGFISICSPCWFYQHLFPMVVLPASIPHGGFTSIYSPWRFYLHLFPMVVLPASIPHGGFTTIYSPWLFYQHLFPLEILPPSIPHGGFTTICSPWWFYQHLFSIMVLPPSTSHGGFTTIYLSNGQRANTLVSNTGQLDGDETAGCKYEGLIPFRSPWRPWSTNGWRHPARSSLHRKRCHLCQHGGTSTVDAPGRHSTRHGSQWLEDPSCSLGGQWDVLVLIISFVSMSGSTGVCIYTGWVIPVACMWWNSSTFENLPHPGHYCHKTLAPVIFLFMCFNFHLKTKGKNGCCSGMGAKSTAVQYCA